MKRYNIYIVMGVLALSFMPKDLTAMKPILSAFTMVSVAVKAPAVASARSALADSLLVKLSDGTSISVSKFSSVLHAIKNLGTSKATEDGIVLANLYLMVTAEGYEPPLEYRYMVYEKLDELGLFDFGVHIDSSVSKIVLSLIDNSDGKFVWTCFSHYGSPASFFVDPGEIEISGSLADVLDLFEK